MDNQTASSHILHEDSTQNIFELILGNAPVGIGYYDRNFRCIYLNPLLATINGLPLEKMIGKTPSEFLPEIGEQVENLFHTAFETAKPVENVEMTGTTPGSASPRTWLTNYYPLISTDGQIIGIGVVVTDITEKKQAEAALLLDENRLEALLKFGEMVDAPLKQITDFAMEEAVRLTKSSIGYLAFVNEDETALEMHSWSRMAMKQCLIEEKPIIYSMATVGLWGEVVRQRKPIITNDYQAPSPLKKGYPEGHVHVKRHMNIPVFDEKKIVAVAGVGNKEAPYDDSDVRQLQLLMSGMWRLVQRKRAKVALNESKAMLSNILNSVPQAIFWKDNNSVYTGCNDVFAKAAGLDRPESVAGKTDFDLPWTKGEAEKYQADDQEVIRTKQPKRHIIEPVQRNDGKRLWVDTTKIPLIDADGNTYGVLGVYEDITERKQAEEALRNSETRYRTLFETANDAIFLMKNDIFIDCNQKALELYGCDMKNLLEQPPYRFSPETQPDGRSSKEKAMEKINATLAGTPQSFEWLHRRYDGTLFNAEVSLSKMGFLGDEMLLAIVRDITERKRAEDTIRTLNETLESRLLALTQPVGDVANIQLSDLFSIDELQKIQDAFALATGVASIITDTQGRPITKPSNFCHLCEHIIRKTEKGLINCYCSDALLGRMHPEGPAMQRCLSGGLWDAGTSICVGDRHIANWLIGQVLEEPVDEEAMLVYAREIGADEEEFRKALAQVPRMPLKQFEKVAQSLDLIAKQLSKLAIQNVQQARFITERKQSENALLGSQQMLQLVLTSFPGVVFWKDNNSVYLGCNKAFATAAGLSDPTHIVGKTDYDLPWAKTEADSYRADDCQVMDTGQAKIGIIETQLQADGGIVWFNTSKVPLVDPAGNIIGVLGTSHDITEQKWAQELVKQTALELAGVFRALPDLYFRMSADGTILDYKAGHTIDLYVPPEVFLGKQMQSVLPPDVGNKYIKAFEDIANGKEQVLIEYTLTVADGEKTFEARLLPLEKGQIVTFIRDITDRKLAEKTRDQLTDQLQSKNDELETIIYVASHDLRSAMVNIQGFSHELLKSYETIVAGMEKLTLEPDVKFELKKGAPESLNFIVTSVKKIDAILNGLLRLSRLGRQALHIEPLEMNVLLAEIVASMEYKLRSVDADITIDQLPLCQADRSLMNQVFSNMIDNAINYRDPSRKLTIHISGNTQVHQSIYCIEDNGIGIDPAYQQKIFNAFHRLAPEKTPGEGLGLSIVQRILDLHGGKVWLDSAPGKGTRFYVSLPNNGRHT